MTATNSAPAARPGMVTGWVTLLVAVTALAFATAALAVSFVGVSSGRPIGMMGGSGGMMGGGMMGGAGPWGSTGIQPGETGYVAGTAGAPRVIRVTAGPGLAFNPSTVSVVRGETVTFVVTTMGPAAHEFMVGPADAVAADAPGTPEIADIGMMQTKALTYTFDGAGPYAFACHAPGHFEAGMRGTITIVPA
jgi:uncharacterized cupredoxin-like copper-binding protein